MKSNGGGGVGDGGITVGVDGMNIDEGYSGEKTPTMMEAGGGDTAMGHMGTGMSGSGMMRFGMRDRVLASPDPDVKLPGWMLSLDPSQREGESSSG